MFNPVQPSAEAIDWVPWPSNHYQNQEAHGKRDELDQTRLVWGINLARKMLRLIWMAEAWCTAAR